ncbi:MAG: hypothetical protein K2X63_03335 [Burkholderiaceae bacterium]|nr:hypothetical protein [Burkholderiaceae bacterium]
MLNNDDTDQQAQTEMKAQAGRSCPLAYRYAPSQIAQAPVLEAETLYVIGGLYGNPFALERVLAMAVAEKAPVTLCFNGDFNWFNIDLANFQHINHAVLQHHAIQGNVEFELHQQDSAAGCGCAYPAQVAHEVVERSNQIHALLQQTALYFPQLLQQFSQLPLYRRYLLGKQAVGVVHGDAESLAGWSFDASRLHLSKHDAELARVFEQAQVDVFACTHTCLPILKQIPTQHAAVKTIINNGAAGMPNFQGTQYGVLTRISVYPSNHQALYGSRNGNLHIDALPIEFDYARWQNNFLANWPANSAGYDAYFERICGSVAWTIAHANP